MSIPSQRGHIQGASLNLTMQMLHARRRTCVVHIRTPLGEGQLHYLGGDLIHASYRHAHGEAALPGLLSLEHGTFVVYDDPPPVDRTITRSHKAVLMAAAITLDERQDEPLVAPTPVGDPSLDDPTADTSLRPTVDRVPHLHLDLRDAILSGEAWSTLRAVDGVRSISDIAGATGLPLDTVRNLLAQHHLLGHVTYTSPLMPPAFWDDTRAATVRIVGPLGRLLLDDAATFLTLEPDCIPKDQAQLFLDQLGQLVSPHKRAAFRTALAPVQAKYGLQEKFR